MKALILAILEFLFGLLSKERKAKDAEKDPERLGRAGDRIRDWMRDQDDSGSGEQPGEGGSGDEGQGLRPD